MPQDARPHIELVTGDAVLDVFRDGQPFFVYNFASPHHAGLAKPYFHPIMGPHGWPITQDGEFPGTLRGHYWHRALFIGHQKVSHRTEAGSRTTSFWEERAGDSGVIVHRAFDRISSGDGGFFVHQTVWRSPEGREVLWETRRVAIPKVPPPYGVIDLELVYRAPREPVRFEPTMYNLLACRVINALCPLAEKRAYTEKYGNLVDFRPLLRGGRLVNSEGLENDAVRGSRAKWVDFSGPLDNAATGGIALLDHPLNERHPTYWHNWNNMTFMASFTFKDHYLLEPGKDLRLRYRVLTHEGDAKAADVEGAWNDFAHRG
jgi:hypothetical protein